MRRSTQHDIDSSRTNAARLAGRAISGFLICLAISVTGASAAAGQASTARPASAAAPTKELPEATRQRVFADLMGCRVDMKAKTDKDSADNKESADAPNPRRVRQYRTNSVTGEQGNAACSRLMLRKYKIQSKDLEAIASEGTSKQWTPPAGAPAR